MILPELLTARLCLRPPASADIPDIVTHAGDREVASTTLNIPHPYAPAMAVAWLSEIAQRAERDDAYTFAITRLDEGRLIGAVSLRLTPAHQRAELGYWVGRPFWGQGICTEAAGAVLAWGFRVAGLQRVVAHHLSRNPASGRVMQKLGMVHEGTLRQHYQKWDTLEDVELYGLLREEFQGEPPAVREPRS